MHNKWPHLNFVGAIRVNSSFLQLYNAIRQQRSKMHQHHCFLLAIFLILVSIQSFMLDYSSPKTNIKRTIQRASFFQGFQKSPSSNKSPNAKDQIKLLEGNSWFCSLNGLKIFVDPVYDTLDFGIPALYKADKKVLDNQTLLKELAEEGDVMIISQGLADHCCPKTQATLCKTLSSDVPILAPPSAAAVLKKYYPEGRVTYLSPGDTIEVEVKGKTLKVTATTGALVGPPWQAKENGYILQSGNSPRVYYEPHCNYDPAELSAAGGADVVVTPVVRQLLPVYGPLVDGMEAAARLARLLGAKTVIPMMNGDLEAEGPLDDVITQEGSPEAFAALLAREGGGARLLAGAPGEPLAL